MALNNFDPVAFLRDTWQQRPMLIRQGWAEWHNPVTPDELAGLACEPDVESRMIVGAAGALAVEPGPIAETRFAGLKDRDWTMLVQAVDQQVPEVAALIDAFRFIPNWRIDDVMVSYATDGGGVGAHFDHYDVFLVQGLGRRRWRVGARCDDSTPLLDHDDLRLLAQFEATDEWVLEPGDILYVPPGFAHEGVAVGGDCMTYSIGFRAPSRQELIGLWVDDVLGGLVDDDRYADPGLALQDNPGEITPAALTQLQGMIAQTLLDPAAFARWFGRYTTTRKYPEIDWAPDAEIDAAGMRRTIATGPWLQRNPASRFAFIAQSGRDVLLMVDGECHDCTGPSADFARAVCAQACFEVDAALAESEATVALLVQLHNQGSIAF
ncbi:JmjC domain-containing protein [Novosphingobium sp.]|uniref:JmjC domain-containing protein n=1 Tax=Novosphingobium sp. TaxID=1874826 RepID=UPI003D0A5075